MNKNIDKKDFSGIRVSDFTADNICTVRDTKRKLDSENAEK